MNRWHMTAFGLMVGLIAAGAQAAPKESEVAKNRKEQSMFERALASVKVDKEQKAKIAKIRQEAQVELRKVRPEKGKSAEALEAARERIAAKMRQDILGVLTKEQKAQYEEAYKKLKSATEKKPREKPERDQPKKRGAD